jgi:hypothetical protein
MAQINGVNIIHARPLERGMGKWKATWFDYVAANAHTGSQSD